MEDIESLVNIIEGRILAEQRKHPKLNWIKIASRRIANDILERDIKNFKKIQNLGDKTNE